MDLTSLPITDVQRSKIGVPHGIGEILVASVGVVLVVCALAAGQHWFDRHFLPSFFLPRRWYVLILTVIGDVIATLSFRLALVARPRAGRLVARTPARAFHIVIAGGLA